MSSDAPSYPMERACPLDPPPEMAELRDHEALRRVRLWDGSTPWLVTRYEDVRAVLTDPRFSADNRTPGYPPTSPGMQKRRREMPNFISMDDPEHARYRRMLAADFNVAHAEALRPMIEKVVEEFLDSLAAAPTPVDLVTAFALPVPSMVICRMLGVPYADHDFFQAQSSRLVDINTAADDALAAAITIRDYLADLVAERERTPQDDLLGRLAARVCDGELGRDEAASMGQLLLVAGHETTANMISFGTLTLLGDPEQAATVRDGDDAVLRSAVDELLRLLTVTHLGRRRAALEDVELDGVTIAAGEGVIAAHDVANRDPESFDEPDRLDVHRKPNPHVAFGHGVHQCLGQHVARVELQIAYPRLLRRFPGLRVTETLEALSFRDDMVTYGPRALPVAW